MPKTQTAEFNFSGKTGVAVLIAIVGLGIFRFLSMADVKDPEVLKVLEEELVLEWRRDILPGFAETVKAGRSLDEAGLDAKALLSPGLVIHKVRASQPVLSFSSRQKVVYEITYSIKSAGGDTLNNTKYFELERSTISKPRLKRASNPFRFYSNFY